MRRTKLVLAAAALMVAMLVAFAAPAMADNGRHNDRNDNNNHQNSFNVVRNDNVNVFRDFDNDDNFCDSFDCNFHRFDRFDRVDNSFQDFEQEADSGDIVQTFDVSQTGDNSNQCVGITGNANTGNAQNQIGLTQFDEFGNPFFFDDFGFFHNGFNDFGFDNVGADLTVTGTSTTSCDQAVNQAAAAG
jgi:hypothetical protein